MKRSSAKKWVTLIMVNGEIWEVPRGFGAQYRIEVAKQMGAFRAGRPSEMIDAVIDAMLLAGFAPTRKAVADWPLRKRVEAIVYCVTAVLKAGDNAVRRHPELPWLPKPWQSGGGEAGPRCPLPTEITS